MVWTAFFLIRKPSFKVRPLSLSLSPMNYTLLDERRMGWQWGRRDRTLLEDRPFSYAKRQEETPVTRTRCSYALIIQLHRSMWDRWPEDDPRMPADAHAGGSHNMYSWNRIVDSTIGDVDDDDDDGWQRGAGAPADWWINIRRHTFSRTSLFCLFTCVYLCTQCKVTTFPWTPP